MHNYRLQHVSIIAFFCLLILIMAQLIVGNQYQIIILLFVGILSLTVGLTVKLEHLLFITFYILLAGSSYNENVRSQVFYLRFGVMAIYLLRAFRHFKHQAQEDKLTGAKHRFHWTGFHSIMLLTLVLAFVSTTYSIAPMLTLQRSLAIALMFFAVLVYLYEVTDSWERMQSLVATMVKASFVLLFCGFFFYLFGHERSVQSTGRLRLFLFGPNALGYLCAILFPAAFWFYSESKGRWQKVFSSAGVLLFITALVLTASRGALLCFLLSGFVLVFLAYRKKLVWYLVGAFLFLSINYIFAPPNIEKMSDVFQQDIVRSETLQTGSGRTDIWKHALEVSHSRPWLGYGFGTVSELFDRGYFSALYSSFQGGSIHNSFLELLLDIGRLGVGMLVVGLLWVFIVAVKVLRQTRNSAHWRFSVTIICCFLSGVISAIFESWLTSPGSIFSFPFWYVAGLVLRMNTFDSSKQAIGPTT